MEDRNMVLHVIDSHFFVLIGIVIYGLSAFDTIVNISYYDFAILSLLVDGAAFVFCVNVFANRKKYCVKEFTACVGLRWVNIGRQLIRLATGETEEIGTFVLMIIVPLLFLWYYYNRREVFTSGQYVYTNGDMAVTAEHAEEERKRDEQRRQAEEAGKDIYFCRSCSFTGSAFENSPAVCSKCGTELIKTGIKKVIWDSLDQQGKDNIRERYWKNGSFPAIGEIILSNAVQEEPPRSQPAAEDR